MTVSTAQASAAHDRVPCETPKGIWDIRTGLAVMTKEPWETCDLMEQQLEVRRDDLGHLKHKNALFMEN